MKKYAMDLLSGDRIIPRHTDRVVIIDWIDVGDGIAMIQGYFEDDGEEFFRALDFDSTVRMA